MGNINRTDDVSQQQEIFTIFATSPNGISGIANGQTLVSSYVVPRACQIQSVQSTCFGISGAPVILLSAWRFVPGTGAASFVIGTTMLVPAFGVSGFMGYSIGAAGNTTLNLIKGDVLSAVQSGGTGAASTQTLINVVVKNIQDIKTWYT